MSTSSTTTRSGAARRSCGASARTQQADSVDLAATPEDPLHQPAPAGRLVAVTAAVLDRPPGIEHAVASGHDARRRELRDRGHRRRAARRRSGLSRLEPASARSRCRSHPRRASERPSPQVRSGVYDSGAGTDGGLSCLANGTRKPISEVREGDYVYATDPETGESGHREVVATLPHTDQLLTLRTSSGEIVTTEDHRYWNATDQAWQESQHLDEGDRLLSADGDVVTVEGIDWSTVHTDDAYDLTIAEFHSFYVDAGDESVLVHNCSPGDSPIWQGFQNWRGKTKTNGLSGSKKRYFEWDYTHNDIEVYDKAGRHLGTMDPTTGEMIKPAVNGRTINVS